ncbi:MAG: multicopper oxidase domain-containing protein [Planctomycetes bacterium]|nr:multicopper oxidase domain-containing protein [Planctomycetota bacterium]
MPLPIIPRGDIHDPVHFEQFSAEVPTFSQDFPLDAIGTPDVYVERQMYHGHDIRLPDGGEIEVWGFEDPDDDRNGLQFPSKPIRVAEGSLVHGRLKPRHGPHTIHWHGIEPMSSSDGVGKLSFEVEDTYVYQWLAAEAGTYFYHCHRNTTLHFEMGMYGALIIDPHPPAAETDLAAPYVTGGPGYVRRGDDLVRYDVERIWVADEMDPRWHELDKDSGIGDLPFDDPDDDPGLNIFQPEHFLITGVFHPLTRTDPRIVARAKVGQKLLLRIICAGYTYHRWTLPLDAEVIAMDGRTLGTTGRPGAHSPYSYPFVQPAGTPFELSSARRWDLLITPTEAGTFPVTVEMFDICSRPGDFRGSCETFIIVDPADGDADGDGDVDLDDFSTLKNHYGTPSGATRAQGDFDGDGDVDLDDFAILKQTFGT